MIVVGITGGMGSGKSTVCQVFSRLGVPVYEADVAAHQIYETHPELVEWISKEISSDAVDKSGKINRKKLGEVVFADEKKLRLLNAQVHPRVKNDFDDWKSKQKGMSYVLKEAAILFESGANEGCDKVITVEAPQELRIARIVERDRKSKAEILRIMEKQMSEEERASRADYVIVNDEKQMVLPQVLKIHAALSR